MNGEEAGRGGGGSVGSGVLENQQLAVCLLGEQELQENRWGGWPLEGCSGPCLQSQPISWMEKQRLKVPRELKCGLSEGGLWAEMADSLRRRTWRLDLLGPRGKRD